MQHTHLYRIRKPFQDTSRLKPRIGLRRPPNRLKATVNVRLPNYSCYGMKIPESTETIAGARQEKRKADDTDPEFQLLEANRKRLLKQDDWIGVAPSRALNLHFLSSKEKSKIGRRRKVEGKQGATTRRGEHAGFVTQQLHPTDDRYTGTRNNGAIRFDPTDIRIRIGTDALTTACSTQADDPNQSHASSDPMLFDQQTPTMAVRETVRTGRNRRISTPHATHGGNAAIDRETTLTDGRPQRYLSPPGRIVPDIFRHEARLHSPSNDQAASVSGSGDHKGTAWTGHQSSPAIRIMQQVEGGEQPLRLVFATSASSPSFLSGGSLRSEGRVVDAAHAGVSQKGPVHHLGNDPELEFESEAMAAAAIVDEKPWKSLLDIPEKSSGHTTTSNISEKSILHYHPAPQRRQAESTSWSQHATQGNETLSSSLISASLPSLSRAQTRVRAHALQTDSEYRNKTTSRQVNEDEKQWENFIFGSDKSSSSETQEGQCESSAQRAWRGSSGYLPLSAAVSSIRSTPLRSSSGRAPRMSDRVHDAARFAPRSGSRTISSPAATPVGFIEELIEAEQGYETAERSAFDEQSVTHGSLQNNASGETDLISSRMFGNTETSRSSLDHAGDGANNLASHDQAGTSEPVRRTRRPPVYDIPDSDDGGLHIVDRDGF